MRGGIASAAMAVFLTACAPGFQGNARAIPDYFYNPLLASELARTVARECGGALGFNGDTWPKLLPEIERQLVSDGFTTAELEQVLNNVPVDRIRADAEAYFDANGLEAGNAQAFCAAGRAEIAKGSDMGSFLRTRS